LSLFEDLCLSDVSGEVGNASKMNLVLQLMAGVTLAGMAEGMALADRAGLNQKDVMEILMLTSLACPLIREKGEGTYTYSDLNSFANL